MVVLGLVSLRRIVATARAGDPLVAANVNRIRAVALLVIAYFLLAVGRSFVAVAIQDDLDVGNPTASLSLTPIVIVLILLALAEIWRRGVELRREQGLTI